MKGIRSGEVFLRHNLHNVITENWELFSFLVNFGAIKGRADLKVSPLGAFFGRLSSGSFREKIISPQSYFTSL
ncbi:MAG: hypothetical protein ACK4OO_00125 [bacterium]